MKTKRFVSLVGLCFLLTVGFSGQVGATDEKELTAMEEQVAQMKMMVESYTSMFSSVIAELKTLKELKDQEETAYSEKIEELSIRLDKLETAVSNLESKVNEQSSEEGSAAQSVEYVTLDCEHSTQPAIQFILEGKNSSQKVFGDDAKVTFLKDKVVMNSDNFKSHVEYESGAVFQNGNSIGFTCKFENLDAVLTSLGLD